MNREDWIELKPMAAIFVITVCLFLVAVVVFAAFEADTYRRLTGKNVTTWDALWVDLRVQEPVREDK